MNPFTIVICPGAWPLTQFFEPLIHAFAGRNQTAICKVQPASPTYSAQNPPSINPDSDYFRGSVLDPLLSEGKDIVVFTHSYGGVYGPSSLEGISKQERETKGLEGGVVAAVLVASFIAPKGTTAMAAMGVDPNNLPGWIVHNECTGLVSFDKASAKAMLFHDLPDQEAEKLADMLPPQPYACFSTPAHWDPYHDSNYKGKLGYIFTEADRIVPLEAQRMYVQMGGIEKTRMLEGSSHSPHIERPGELADVVLDLVKEIIAEKQ
ncbi:hypothetical protein V8F20_004951 [Naviculisporaceae sp. PSN 640]